MSKPRFYIPIIAISGAIVCAMPLHAADQKTSPALPAGPPSLKLAAATTPSPTLARGWMWNLDNLPEGVLDRLAASLTLPGSTARKPRPPGFRTLRVEGSAAFDPLQQELLRASLRRAENSPSCPGELPAFPALLNQATDALDFVEKDRARELLTLAKLHLQCGTTPLNQADLARLIFLTGVLDLYNGVNTTPAFEQALVYRPDYPEPSTWPAQVGKSFRAAKQKVSALPQVEIQLEPITPGFQLWLNGKQAAAGPLKLPVGMHVLQWSTAQGVLLGAKTLELKANSRDVKWPPPELRPLDEAALRERLSLLIRNKGGDEPLVNALLTVARQNEADYLVLAGKLSNGEASALYLGPGVLQAANNTPLSGGSTGGRPATSAGENKPSSGTSAAPAAGASGSVLPWVRTGVLGVATVGLAAGYGSLFARYELGGETVETEAEAQQISTLSGVLVGGAAIGAAATTVSALHAAGILKFGGGEAEPAVTALPLAGPGTLGVLLSGRW